MKTLNKLLNKLEISNLAVAVSSVALVAFGYLITSDNPRNIFKESTSKTNYSEFSLGFGVKNYPKINREDLESAVFNLKYDYLNELAKKLVPKYNSIITESFVDKIINLESGGDSLAVSLIGAKGLAQFMPLAWEEVQKTDEAVKDLDYDRFVFKPNANRYFAVDYLNIIAGELKRKCPDWSILTFNEKRELIGAGYNGGKGALEKSKYNINEMPEETQKYVSRLASKNSNF